MFWPREWRTWKNVSPLHVILSGLKNQRLPTSSSLYGLHTFGDFSSPAQLHFANKANLSLSSLPPGERGCLPPSRTPGERGWKGQNNTPPHTPAHLEKRLPIPRHPQRVPAPPSLGQHSQTRVRPHLRKRVSYWNQKTAVISQRMYSKSCVTCQRNLLHVCFAITSLIRACSKFRWHPQRVPPSLRQHSQTAFPNVRPHPQKRIN